MFTVQVFDRGGTLALLERAPDIVLEAVHAGLAAAGREFEGEYVQRRLRGTGGSFQARSAFTDRLQSRTGATRRSFTSLVQGGATLGDLKLRVGFGAKPGLPAPAWIQIHEEGGRIRPRSGKFLAIPIADNLTGTGRARLQSPRQIPGGALFAKDPDKPGQILVFDERGRLLFLLRRFVTIRPRLNFRADWGRFYGSRFLVTMAARVTARLRAA